MRSDSFTVGGLSFKTEGLTSEVEKTQKLIHLSFDLALLKPDYLLLFEQGKAEPIIEGALGEVPLVKRVAQNGTLVTYDLFVDQIPTEKAKVCLTERHADYSKVLCHEPIVKARSLQVGGRPVKAQKIVPLGGEQKLAIIYQNKDISLFFETDTPGVEVFELSEDDYGNLKIVAFGAPIFGPVTQVMGVRSTLFQHTIGDTRIFYEVRIPKEAPFLNVSGASGIIFSFEILGQEFPMDSSRVQLQEPVVKSTYGETLELQVGLKPGMKAESKTLAVDGTTWFFSAPETNKMNRGELQVTTTTDSGTTKSVYEFDVFRGPRNYASARVGLSLASGRDPSLVTDLLAAHWLNEPFGHNHFLSRQRWGLSLGYVSTVVGGQGNFTSSFGDVLYRLTPGVYGWTETFGFSLSMLQVQFPAYRPVNFAGVGLFWSRSLPEWFNYIFGFIPFFRKPKWTDIQAVFYPSPLTTGVNGNSFQVRATGRIDLNKDFYFEGGWALGSTKYVDVLSERRASVLAGRGFLGFGGRF